MSQREDLAVERFQAVERRFELGLLLGPHGSLAGRCELAEELRSQEVRVDLGIGLAERDLAACITERLEERAELGDDPGAPLR